MSIRRSLGFLPGLTTTFKQKNKKRSETFRNEHVCPQLVLPPQSPQRQEGAPSCHAKQAESDDEMSIASLHGYSCFLKWKVKETERNELICIFLFWFVILFFDMKQRKTVLHVFFVSGENEDLGSMEPVHTGNFVPLLVILLCRNCLGGWKAWLLIQHGREVGEQQSSGPRVLKGAEPLFSSFFLQVFSGFLTQQAVLEPFVSRNLCKFTGHLGLFWVEADDQTGRKGVCGCA